MLKCNYCGRLFKKSVESCPGCGASQFIEVESVNNVVISNPPEGGYTMDLSISAKDKIVMVIGGIFYLVGLYFITQIFLALFIALFEFEFTWMPFLSFAILIELFQGISCLLFGHFLVKNIIVNSKKRKYLKYNGVLVKNMPYYIVNTGSVVNGVPIYAVKVVYKDSKGIEIPLVSKREYKGHGMDKDGGVDLLIDPNDYTNYYIDFEIY